MKKKRNCLRNCAIAVDYVEKTAGFRPTRAKSGNRVFLTAPVTVFEKMEAIDEQWYPIVQDYCKENELELSRIVPAHSDISASWSSCFPDFSKAAESFR